MTPNDEDRLRDMVLYCEKALRFVAGRQRQDVEADEILCLALVRVLEIIGEAAAQLAAETRSAHPQIPWADIIGMRDRIVHTYTRIDMDIIWQTLNDDLRPLIDELKPIISDDPA
ncbi:MAG: DUF86 domain-containing protein [Planctomycetes bacterium]|nr:DUF86 domain-containing protein [Planctomycetota bacterium]